MVVDGANYSTSTSSFPFAGLLSTTGSTGGPKAYLNWLIFDRNYTFITGGYSRLSATPSEHGQDVAYERLYSPDLVIAQPGYVYVYLSNEETTPVEVYFDDFTVTHVKSPIIASDDYYPFGLTFNSYSRENSVTNQYQYNGKETQDELGLGWLDYGARMFMPEIGRWGVIDPKSYLLEMSSPFVYSLNNPVNFVDIDGELPIYINGRVSSDEERGSSLYWDTQLLRTIANSGVANPGGTSMFVDGDRGMAGTRSHGETIGTANSENAASRIKAGRAAGREDFNRILQQLEKDPKTGKITEKIQIYAHSRGAAFGQGYTEALLEMIGKNAGLFEDANNVIDFVYNMAPHQSDQITSPKGVDGYSQDHEGDQFSGNNMKGVVASFTSKERKDNSPTGTHANGSFSRDVGAFRKSFKQSGKIQNKLIRNFVWDMQTKYGIEVKVKK